MTSIINVVRDGATALASALEYVGNELRAIVKVDVGGAARGS